jgi:parallel beta-helix repeat protein
VYVDDDYNQYTPGWNYDHFSKIQNGINVVTENGTVYVFNGTYYENVNVIKNNLTIVGENKNTTIIDGGITGFGVIYIDHHHFTKIAGFSMRNGAQEGVYIRDAHDNEISNCTIYQCPEYGVAILGETVRTTNNSVRDCELYNNLIGGVSFWGYEYNYLVDNNAILRCNIHDNTNFGVAFRTNKNTGTMRGNNIVHCIIHNNSGSGITMDLQGGTIYNCLIHGTLISNNSASGIYMKNVYATVISACTISNNGNYGIQLITSSNNTIYHNIFMQNNQQAFDYSLNAWDNGYPSGGNYWDDYTGVDSNNDSIGDTPYNISGGSNQDHYPFMQPNGWFNQPPVIPTVVGPTTGLINGNYTFCITATDPNEFNLYSKWDWGDGNITDWLGPYSSGETVCASHIWPHKGTYDVKVKLKNENDHESSWSDPHVITIYELKKVLMIGRYTNMTTDGDFVTIQVVSIWIILFNPTQFTHYNSGEKMTFSKANSNVIFSPRFLIGLVNILS